MINPTPKATDIYHKKGNKTRVKEQYKCKTFAKGKCKVAFTDLNTKNCTDRLDCWE